MAHVTWHDETCERCGKPKDWKRADGSVIPMCLIEALGRIWSVCKACADDVFQMHQMDTLVNGERPRVRRITGFNRARVIRSQE